MIDELSGDVPDGTPAAPIPNTGIDEDRQAASVEQVNDDNHDPAVDAAVLKHLLQDVHDKIVALGGEHWIVTMTDELRQARQAVEHAGEWLAEHFHRLEQF